MTLALLRGAIAAALPALAEDVPPPSRRDNGVSIFAVYPIGPSSVTDLSRSEVSKDGRPATWLNGFALDLTLTAPPPPQPEALFRLHHRSGALG
ncbi:hypothetical protein [Roseomonas fluvialis]|uniref:Uncharacterized protein n=1 Tax=Roseomonas fluvialis TaxID=1750527 RepID=A0ABN6P020_9PROT|nr:hypothetical protein [Roseomonas fluvialis]BDG71058.1 hypothetical protein Rmf_09870 [Roseomonas fluvialis]